ncbi:MAG: GGDEF domain-containing protein [Bacilli bacterium]|nr:GGDEF domain-containing protein [Bacilli bacterium]
MKKNNKISKIIILSSIGLIFTISLIIFILNYTKDSTGFSILEKNWINNHKSNVIDVSVYNDIPVYGQDGEGIIFSYLEEFTNSYEIEFNKVSYLSDGSTNLKNVSFKILNYNDSLSENDIEIYKDYYVIISKDGNNIDDIFELKSENIGVLDTDVSNVRYFLNDGNGVKFTSCKDFDEMLELIKKEEVSYLVVPYNQYLDDILKNELRVVYHLSDLYKKYVLTVNNDKTLRSIMNKFFMIYQNEYLEDNYKKYLINTFFKHTGISEVERMNYNATSYVYGYVTNMPYENTVNKEFVGNISNYLSGFEDLVDVDFKIIEYKNINELKQAFSRGEVDLLFANFNTSGVNVDVLNTTSPFKEEYVILTKKDIIMNSIRSLKNYEVLTVNNTYLYDYLIQNGVNSRGYDNTDELLRNISNESIVILNLDTYEYYKDTKFKNYKVIYQNKIDSDYTFAIRDVNKNQTFYRLYDFYIGSINYKNLKYKYNTDYIINSKNEIGNMVKYILTIIGTTLLLLVILYLCLRKRKNKEDLTKDDKLKFIDVMTSLKNRNYLNYNINSWEENVIYPQAIVIIDLNNIKYINDNYGHAEGDEVIKKAASILIVNQIENTDIVRTDGNEFLVYMVGYEEKKVQEYMRKISKEMKELPHEFGATLGYSMITDNIKTIDDAINEATLSMRAAKEKL